MNRSAEAVPFASVGEIMLECIVQVPRLPRPNSTLVVGPALGVLGGAALNVAWYLGRLGDPTSLVGPVGAHDLPLLRALKLPGLVDIRGVVGIPGRSDLLIAVVSGHQHLSAYALAQHPPGLREVLLRRVKPVEVLILNGSRHPVLRAVHVALATNPTRPDILIFNPSYAVYQYKRSELGRIVSAADITIVNSDEARFIRRVLGSQPILPKSGRDCRILVITKGNRGAEIRQGSFRESLPSPIRRQGLFLGAGDAFTAGFAHRYYRSRNPRDALRFGLAAAAATVEADRIRAPLTERAISRWL